MKNFYNTTCEIINWDPIVSVIRHNSYQSKISQSDYNYTLDSFRLDSNDDYLNFYLNKILIGKMEKFTNTMIKDCYFTRLNPGHIIKMTKFTNISEGNIKRFLCFVTTPKFGHVLILDNALYYNIEKGSLFILPNLTVQHAVSNSGADPFFLCHYIGSSLC